LVIPPAFIGLNSDGLACFAASPRLLAFMGRSLPVRAAGMMMVVCSKG
jgi:hypothetical protein